MAIASGTITTSSGSVTLTLGPQDGLCRIQTSGTFTGITYALTASADGTNSTPIACIDDSIYGRDADGSFSTQSAGKFLQLNCSLLKTITLTSSAYSSGTMNVYMVSAPMTPINGLFPTQIAGG